MIRRKPKTGRCSKRLREGSESAFRLLVERHSGWVYAAAFRQLRDANLAEDATQAVFVLLCKRAKKMKPEQKLSGWLFVTLGYTVKSIQRSRRRRQRYEKLAAIERPTSYATPPLADGLDEAVARLSEIDRIAILLRFYQGLEFASVGRRLGVSEEAAKKRVARAVTRLREWLGTAVSDESLTAASAFGAGGIGDAERACEPCRIGRCAGSSGRGCGPERCGLSYGDDKSENRGGGGDHRPLNGNRWNSRGMGCRCIQAVAGARDRHTAPVHQIIVAAGTGLWPARMS